MQWTPEQREAIASALRDLCMIARRPTVAFSHLRACDARLAAWCGCAIARVLLPLLPATEHRPRRAIEATESWCRGEATEDDVAQASTDAIVCAAEIQDRARVVEERFAALRAAGQANIVYAAASAYWSVRPGALQDGANPPSCMIDWARNHSYLVQQTRDPQEPESTRRYRLANIIVGAESVEYSAARAAADAASQTEESSFWIAKVVEFLTDQIGLTPERHRAIDEWICEIMAAAIPDALDAVARWSEREDGER